MERVCQPQTLTWALSRPQGWRPIRVPLTASPAYRHSHLLPQSSLLGLGVGQLQSQMVRGTLRRSISRSFWQQQAGWLPLQKQFSQPLEGRQRSRGAFQNLCM